MDLALCSSKSLLSIQSPNTAVRRSSSCSSNGFSRLGAALILRSGARFAGGGARFKCSLAGGSAAAMAHDAASAGLVLAGAYGLVRTFKKLTDRHIIDKNLSRKIVHVLSGLLFMSSWPMFSPSAEARFFAAVVPLVNCVRLIIYGLSLVKDEDLIKSVTREGKPEELLRGPLYYVLVLVFCAVVFWRESPIGVVSVATMSGGDGFADILGRRFGTVKLPYNKRKSWIGSISMYTFGFLFSIGMLYYFSCFGLIHMDWSQAVQKVALISLVATMVESLPITDSLDDNLAVPLSSMFTAFLVFRR